MEYKYQRLLGAFMETLNPKNHEECTWMADWLKIMGFERVEIFFEENDKNGEPQAVIVDDYVFDYTYCPLGKYSEIDIGALGRLLSDCFAEEF